MILVEIRDFFLNPTVTNFVVASVFSQTFYPLILELVKNLILPIISTLIFKIETKGLSFKLRGVDIVYGDFISQFVIFVLSMLSLFFLFIKPFSSIIQQKENNKEMKTQEKNKQIKEVVNSVKNIEEQIVEFNVLPF